MKEQMVCVFSQHWQSEGAGSLISLSPVETSCASLNGYKQGRGLCKRSFSTSAASPALSQRGTSPLSQENTFCCLSLCRQCSHNNWSNHVHVPRDGAKYVLRYRQVGQKKKGILGGDGAVVSAAIIYAMTGHQQQTIWFVVMWSDAGS